jgi:pyruvate-formate lyase-activating enzyme
MEKIAGFLSSLHQVTKIRVLPYHNYAGSKYEALHIENTLPTQLPTDEELAEVQNIIKQITHIDVLS